MTNDPDWTKADKPQSPCPKCNQTGGIEYQEWESSCGGYDDYKYRCTKCNAEWWIEGADA